MKIVLLIDNTVKVFYEVRLSVNVFFVRPRCVCSYSKRISLCFANHLLLYLKKHHHRFLWKLSLSEIFIVFSPKNKSVNFDEWWLAHSKLTWHFGLGVRRLGEGEFCPKKLSLCSPPPQCIMVNSLAVATPSGHIFFFFFWWWWSPWCHNARCWP